MPATPPAPGPPRADPAIIAAACLSSHLMANYKIGNGMRPEETRPGQAGGRK
jgi:hypothetical protein